MKNFYAIQFVFITELLVYLLLFPHNGFAQHFAGYATVGAQSEYSIISGHYADSLNNGIGAGFFLLCPCVIGAWFMAASPITGSPLQKAVIQVCRCLV